MSRYDDLLARFLAGGLTDEERDELGAILASDPERRREASDLLALGADLDGIRIRRPDADQRAHGVRSRDAGDFVACVEAGLSGPRPAGRWRRGSIPLAWAAAAALLAGVLVPLAASRFDALRPAHILEHAGSDEVLIGRDGVVEARVSVAGGRPAEGVLVRARLLTSDRSEVARGSARTDDTGIARIEVEGDVRPGERYDLVLVAAERFPWSERRLEVPVRVITPVRIFLTGDKSFYRPGQSVRFRALAVRTSDQRPVEPGETIRFDAHDPNGNRIFHRTLALADGGVAWGELPLAKVLIAGTYRLSATVGAAAEERTFEVADYRLPRFTVEIEAPDAIPAAGEICRVVVRARYVHGAPVAAGRVRLEGVGPEQEGSLDGNGERAFAIRMPATLEAGVRAEVEDPAGRSETAWLRLGGIHGDLVLDAVPEGGGLEPGVPNTIYLALARAKGTPVANATIRVDGKFATTDEHGLASLVVRRDFHEYERTADLRCNFRVDAPGTAGPIDFWRTFPRRSDPTDLFVKAFVRNGALVVITVRASDDLPVPTRVRLAGAPRASGPFRAYHSLPVDPSGRRVALEIDTIDGRTRQVVKDLRPPEVERELAARLEVARRWAAGGAGFLLRTDRALVDPGGSAAFEIASTIDGDYQYVVRREGRRIDDGTVTVTGGGGAFDWRVPEDLPGGLVSVHAIAPAGGQAARWLFVGRPRELSVAVEASEPTRRPGEPIAFHVSVAGPDGRPSAALLGVDIVDAAVHALGSGGLGAFDGYFSALPCSRDDRFRASTTHRRLDLAAALREGREDVARHLFARSPPPPLAGSFLHTRTAVAAEAVTLRVRILEEIVRVGSRILVLGLLPVLVLLSVGSRRDPLDPILYRAAILPAIAVPMAWMLTHIEVFGAAPAIAGVAVAPFVLAGLRRLPASIQGLPRREIVRLVSLVAFLGLEALVLAALALNPAIEPDEVWTQALSLAPAAVALAAGRRRSSAFLFLLGLVPLAFRIPWEYAWLGSIAIWLLYVLERGRGVLVSREGPRGRPVGDLEAMFLGTVAIVILVFPLIRLTGWLGGPQSSRPPAARLHHDTEEILRWNLERSDWVTTRLTSGLLAKFGSGVSLGQAYEGPVPEPTRLRQSFPETLTSVPVFRVGASGRTMIEVPGADSITTWRARVLASSPAGALGQGMGEVRVVLPFRVRIDPPLFATKGDRFRIPVVVFNDGPADRSYRVTVRPGPGLEVAGSPEGIRAIAAGGFDRFDVVATAGRVGRTTFAVEAVLDGGGGDAVEATIEVVSGGRPVERVESIRVDGRRTIDLDLPAERIVGSERLVLRAHASPLGPTLAAVEGLAREPYG